MSFSLEVKYLPVDGPRLGTVGFRLELKRLGVENPEGLETLAVNVVGKTEDLGATKVVVLGLSKGSFV